MAGRFKMPPPRRACRPSKLLELISICFWGPDPQSPTGGLTGSYLNAARIKSHSSFVSGFPAPYRLASTCLTLRKPGITQPITG